jgi:hypothetical protein
MSHKGGRPTLTKAFVPYGLLSMHAYMSAYMSVYMTFLSMHAYICPTHLSMHASPTKVLEDISALQQQQTQVNAINSIYSSKRNPFM